MARQNGGKEAHKGVPPKTESKQTDQRCNNMTLWSIDLIL